MLRVYLHSGHRFLYYPHYMQHLILLHGAVDAKHKLEPLENELKSEFKAHLINFSGNGGEPILNVKFFIALFAEYAASG